MSICVTIFIHKFCNKGDKYITERLKLVKTDGFAHRFLSHGFTVIHQYFYSFHWLALDGRLISFDFPTSQPLFHIVSPFAHRIHFSICIWGASSTFFVGVQIFFLWSGAVDFGYTHLTLSFEKAGLRSANPFTIILLYLLNFLWLPYFLKIWWAAFHPRLPCVLLKSRWSKPQYHLRTPQWLQPPTVAWW